MYKYISLYLYISFFYQRKHPPCTSTEGRGTVTVIACHTSLDFSYFLPGA